MEQEADGHELASLASLEPRTQILVIPISEAQLQYAVEVSSRLRQAFGARVELYLKLESTLGNALAHAHRRGIPEVVLVGEEEAADRNITIRHMAEGEQRTLPLEDVSAGELFRERREGVSPHPSAGRSTKGATNP